MNARRRKAMAEVWESLGQLAEKLTTLRGTVDFDDPSEAHAFDRLALLVSLTQAQMLRTRAVLAPPERVRIGDGKH